MANLRELKKDINHVLGDIIGAVKEWQLDADKAAAAKGEAIIDEIIAVFDDLIEKVNNKSVENRKAHLKSVRAEFEAKAGELVEKVNALA